MVASAPTDGPSHTSSLARPVFPVISSLKELFFQFFQLRFRVKQMLLLGYGLIFRHFWRFLCVGRVWAFRGSWGMRFGAREGGSAPWHGCTCAYSSLSRPACGCCGHQSCIRLKVSIQSLVFCSFLNSAWTQRHGGTVSTIGRCAMGCKRQRASRPCHVRLRFPINIVRANS